MRAVTDSDHDHMYGKLSAVTWPSSRSGRWATSAVLAGLSIMAGCSSPTINGQVPSLGRDGDGALYLIGRPCESVDLTALAIVEVASGGAETPVLRIEFEQPTSAWDVIIPLDPLDVDQSGFVLETFDEAGLATALANTGDGYRVLSETLSADGSSGRSLDPFRPGALSANAAFDYEDMIENPADYGCPRGKGKPWADAFDG